MRHLLILMTFITAAFAMCLPGECETEGFFVKTRNSENPLESEPMIKNKIVASSRFWGKRALPDELRRASIRWGKRWDPKMLRQVHSNLLRPAHIIGIPRWPEIMSIDEKTMEPATEVEDDVRVLRVAKAVSLRPKLALSSRLWGR